MEYNITTVIYNIKYQQGKLCIKYCSLICIHNSHTGIHVQDGPYMYGKYVCMWTPMCAVKNMTLEDSVLTLASTSFIKVPSTVTVVCVNTLKFSNHRYNTQNCPDKHHFRSHEACACVTCNKTTRTWNKCMYIYITSNTNINVSYSRKLWYFFICIVWLTRLFSQPNSTWTLSATTSP